MQNIPVRHINVTQKEPNFSESFSIRDLRDFLAGRDLVQELEAFSKRHVHFNKLDPKVGGPTEIEMLHSKEEIMADFENYEVLMLEETEILLNEGKYHNGMGAVIRFVGRKVKTSP